jgi:hypothetical protein
VGAAGLDLLVLPPRFVWHLDSLDDVVEVGLFVVVGVVIAAGASRTERARRTDAPGSDPRLHRAGAP